MAKGKCAVCKEKAGKFPLDSKKYCEKCWEKRLATLRNEEEKFVFSRYLRTEGAEGYFVRYRGSKEYPTACGELFVFENKKTEHFHLVCILQQEVEWKRVCYKDSVDEVKLIDVLVGEAIGIIESWGAGQWDLDVFYSTSEGATNWSGEI